MIDHPGNRARVQRPDVFALGDRAQKTRIEEIGIVLAHQHLLEISSDFEEVRKIGIDACELIIEPAITEEDDLHIKGNGGWFEGGGRHRAGSGAWRFDFDASAP